MAVSSGVSHRFWLTVLALLLPALALAACSGRSKAEKLHAQGNLFYKNHQYYKAIQKYEEGLKLQPDHLGLLAECADAYLKTGKPEESIRYGEKIVALDPKNAKAWLLMGQAHLALARGKAAQSEGGEKKLDPLELGKAAEIATQLTRAKPDSPEGLLLQAHIDQLNGQWRSAERLFGKVLEQTPNNLIALLGMADTAIAQKQYAKAETLARRAVKAEASPQPAALNALALSLALQQRYDEAYGVIEPSISEANKEPDAQFYLLAGNILLSQIRALSGDRPTSPTVLEGAQPPPVRRIETPAAAKAANPALTRATQRLGELSARMKAHYPSIPESYYFRSISFELQGNLDEAIHNMEQACTHAPNTKPFRLTLALLHVKKKEYAKARQELLTLLGDFPGDFDAQIRLAQCYAAEGSYEEAIELLRGLRLEHPQSGEVKETLGKVLVLTSEPKSVDEGIALLAETGATDKMPGGRPLLAAQASLREAAKLAQAGQGAPANAKYKEAEGLFKEVLRLQPGNLAAELKISDLAVRRGDLFTALEHARNAARIDPQYQPIKARIFARLGQVDSARRIYNDLLKDNTNAVGYELAIADLDLQERHNEDALSHYRELVNKYPTDARPVQHLAVALERSDRRAEAVKLLYDGLNRFPEELTLRLTLAQMQLKNNQPAETAKLMAIAIQKLETRASGLRTQPEAEPAMVQARRSLASLYYELALAEILADQIEPAEAHTAKMIEDDPTLKTQGGILLAIIALEAHQGALAVSFLKGLPKDSFKEVPALAILSSLAALAAGDGAQARAAIEQQPGLNPHMLVLYGRMLEKNPPEALAAVARPLGLQVYLAMRPDFNLSAKAKADEALKILPGDPFVLTRKAEALQVLGQTTEALAAYQQVARAMPDFAPALAAQADLHLALSEPARVRGDRAKAEEETLQAIELYRQTLQKAPRDAQILGKLANLQQSRGQLAEANQLFRQAIGIDPNNWNAYNNLAWDLAEANQLDEAAQWAEKALKLAPEMGGVQDTLGWIELKRGHLERAIELFGKASRSLPNDPEVRYHLALADQKKGLKAEAVAELEAIALATPKYAKIEEVRSMLEQLNPQSEILVPKSDPSTTAKRAGAARP